MTSAADFEYQGHELALFRHATNWKQYYASRLVPHIFGSVLEVGAGIGGTARFLCTPATTSWTALEPDETLAAQLRETLRHQPLPVRTEVFCGTTAALTERRFHTILYIDVLEHIEDDRGELRSAMQLLHGGGRLIVLCPAHNFLFSPFDRAIGHFRRYSKRMLLDAAPEELKVVRAFYLDCFGMLASLANRLLLRSDYPTAGQIHFWDTTIVPLSKLLDPLIAYSLGKTVVGIWTTE